jgi:hypothetical protein
MAGGGGKAGERAKRQTQDTADDLPVIKGKETVVGAPPLSEKLDSGRETKQDGGMQRQETKKIYEEEIAKITMPKVSDLPKVETPETKAGWPKAGIALLAERIGDQLVEIDRGFADQHGTDTYLEMKERLSAVATEFRQLLASMLEPVFNEVTKELPTDTYEDKQTFCKVVNSELNDLGLAVMCPFTGYPARLVAGTGGNPEKGRFEFVSYNDEGKRIVKTATTLPDHLNLVVARVDRLPGWTVAEKILCPTSTDE